MVAPQGRPSCGVSVVVRQCPESGRHSPRQPGATIGCDAKFIATGALVSAVALVWESDAEDADAHKSALIISATPVNTSNLRNISFRQQPSKFCVLIFTNRAISFHNHSIEQERTDNGYQYIWHKNRGTGDGIICRSQSDAIIQ